MTMLCTTCMETKDEAEFYSVVLGRFIARCSACRAIDDALKGKTPEGRSRHVVYPLEARKRPAELNRPPSSNIRIIQDAFVAPALAYVIAQLAERDHAAKR